MANRVIRWSGTEPHVAEDPALPPRDRRRLRLTLRGRVAVAVGVAALAVGAVLAVRAFTAELPTQEPALAAPSPSASPEPPAPAWEAPRFAEAPAEPALAATSEQAVLDLAATLFEQAPVVVVARGPAPTGPTAEQRLARWLALRLHAPLVHPGAGLAPLVEALDVRTAVVVGLPAPDDRLVRDLVPEVRAAFVAAGDTRFTPRDGDLAPDPSDPAAAGAGDDPTLVRQLSGPPVPAWLAEVRTLLQLARAAPSPPARTTGMLARTTDAASWALVTTGTVAGLPTVAAGGPDPRADVDVVARLGGLERLSAIGARGAWADADPQTLAWQLETVRQGHMLPGGGQTLFPGKLLIALYGHPEGGALGVLGEQPVDEAIARAADIAAPYRALGDETVVPTFEIIATVASRGAEPTGDYSRRTPIATLRPWVDAAREAGVYVVLDLQPGRSSFLAQAQEYEELLREPHVGLALDPEWRLGPDQVHLRQIGSVQAAEVNETAGWLAGLVRRERLPQKLFVVHQFKLSMIADRSTLALGHPELAPVIHVDGQGGQAAKDETYRAVTQLDPPAHVSWGWKNFFDEDVPGIRSPAATYAVEPRPVMISYQ